MRVLVTGGRNYQDWKRVFDELEKLAPSSIVHGAATGADTLAGTYAKLNEIPVREYPAKWYRNGVFDRSAGPRRNVWMLKDSKPDMVLAFPGGDGTANMVALAKACGVKVVEVGA